MLDISISHQTPQKAQVPAELLMRMEATNKDLQEIARQCDEERSARLRVESQLKEAQVSAPEMSDPCSKIVFSYIKCVVCDIRSFYAGSPSVLNLCRQNCLHNKKCEHARKSEQRSFIGWKLMN